MRFMDTVREDMAVAKVEKGNAEDRIQLRRKIRCGDPWWEKPKEEEEEVLHTD